MPWRFKWHAQDRLVGRRFIDPDLYSGWTRMMDHEAPEPPKCLARSVYPAWVASHARVPKCPSIHHLHSISGIPAYVLTASTIAHKCYYIYDCTLSHTTATHTQTQRGLTAKVVLYTALWPQIQHGLTYTALLSTLVFDAQVTKIEEHTSRVTRARARKVWQAIDEWSHHRHQQGGHFVLVLSYDMSHAASQPIAMMPHPGL